MPTGYYERPERRERQIEIATFCDNVHETGECDFDGDVVVDVDGVTGTWTCPDCGYDHTIEVDA